MDVRKQEKGEQPDRQCGISIDGPAAIQNSAVDMTNLGTVQIGWGRGNVIWIEKQSGP